MSGLLVSSGGEIRLYGKNYTDAAIRARMGVLIENPDCFPGSTVYQSLMMQALNLNIKNPKAEVERVLKLVSMAGAVERKFKQCSLGMKQRLGVAQSLLGRTRFLVLDEPIICEFNFENCSNDFILKTLEACNGEGIPFSND